MKTITYRMAIKNIGELFERHGTPPEFLHEIRFFKIKGKLMVYLCYMDGDEFCFEANKIEHYPIR